MKGKGGKNAWALFLLLLAGIVLGGFIGMLADGVSSLNWLSYGQTFGLDDPVVLNLGLLVVTFGLTIKIYHCKHHWRDCSNFHLSFPLI